MGKLPNIYMFDPDEWHDRVMAIAESLSQHIRDALDEHDTPRAVAEALHPYLEPYIIEAGDPTLDQLQARAEGDVLFIGMENGEWYSLTYRDEGHWWFEDEEPGRQDLDAGDLHAILAELAVSAVTWGDDDIAYQRSEEQREHRQFVEPYLNALQEHLESGETKSADLREHLKALILACVPDDASMGIEDISPDDHHTEFLIQRDGAPAGRILAVDPGESLDPEALTEAFDTDVDADSNVRFVTDHIRFEWTIYPTGSVEPVELQLPSQKDADVVEYHYAIDWVARLIELAIRP